MSSRPKLLFVYDMPEWKVPSWMDGLWAALNLLEEDFEIVRHNLSSKFAVPWDGDEKFVLGWGGFNSRVDQFLQKQPETKGLCIGGNAFPPNGADNYDVLFYETKWYRPQISFHKNIVHAFGVNTDIFSPSPIPTPVVWDYIGVGSFSNWKRWEKMLDKKGNRLVVGEMQKDNVLESGKIAGELLAGGVMVSNMVNSYDLANLYQWSRTLYIPADTMGGGERAVLEARACGLKVEIEDDNPKLKELLDGEIKDHVWYSEQLKKGIMSVL
jgi:hypothetical protein